jgi:amino acid transporter
MPHDEPGVQTRTPDEEDALLAELGYQPQLVRAIGRFGSFCVAFSLISATTAVFTTFGFGLATAGPSFLWTFPIAVLVLGAWVLIASDLASRIPLAGFAYQWTSRLVGRGLGWFTGFLGIVAFTCGMTGVTYVLAGYFGELVGIEATTANQVWLTVAFMSLVVLINVFGVRIATTLNNIGVGVELLVTLGGTLVVAVAALVVSQAPNGVDVLFSRGVVEDSPFVFAWLTAILVGLFGLIGAEAAADVAEETKDTRRTVPRTMMLAFGCAAVVEFLMYAVFLLATPDVGVATASATPLTYVLQAHLGSVATDVFVALALTNLFACALANMLVVTRLVFSMARDNMLPASGFFATVSPRFRVPANATIVIGCLSSAFVVSSLASEQALAYILGVATLAFFLVYLLTAAGLWRAHRHGAVAAFPSGGFDLGCWREPVYASGVALFLATVLALTLLPDYRVNGRNMLVVVALGGLWYALALRKRLARGEAGAPSPGGGPGPGTARAGAQPAAAETPA